MDCCVYISLLRTAAAMRGGGGWETEWLREAQPTHTRCSHVLQRCSCGQVAAAATQRRARGMFGHQPTTKAELSIATV